MTKYVGYVDVPHATYSEWKSNTNGNGYDIDGAYGCQCWDFASLFWQNIGFPMGYPQLLNSKAYTMWNLRNLNSGYQAVTYFDLIYNVNDVQQGDIIVFNYTSNNEYGHVGFADVDYGNWTPDPNQPYEFPILSENNQGTPDPSGGAYVNIHGYDIRLFLGAFRYKGWHPTPPTPTYVRSKYPFILLSRRRRLLRKYYGL